MLMEPVNAPARWWLCTCLQCVSCLRALDKTLTFLRREHVIDLVPKYGSGINEENWLQLQIYFNALMSTVASVLVLSFFSRVSGFRSKVSRIALLRKRLQLESKKDLTTNGLILGLYGKWLLSLTSYQYGLKSGRFAPLLFFLDAIIFFDV